MEVDSREGLTGEAAEADLPALVSSMKHRDLVAVVQSYIRSCGESDR